MNAVTMDREKEIEIVKKKLTAMENLNRVLSKERNDLLQVGFVLCKRQQSSILSLNVKLNSNGELKHQC